MTFYNLLGKTDFLFVWGIELNICQIPELRITISITICSEASKNFNNLSYTSTKIGNYEKNL